MPETILGLNDEKSNLFNCLCEEFPLQTIVLSEVYLAARMGCTFWEAKKKSSVNKASQTYASSNSNELEKTAVEDKEKRQSLPH